jgi:hypothetical protein
LLFLLGLTISPANAAPILNLQATAVSESVIGGQPCDFIVSGPNFEFRQDVVGYCSGTMRTGPGPLSGFVDISTPGYGGQTAPLQGPTTGDIDVPQNPGRYAEFFGSVSADDLVTVPSSNVPFQLGVDVSLTGSFTACLLPLHGGPSSSCDPSYMDFANIDVDIVGQDVFSFTPIGDGEYTYTEAFTGTLAPVPEPASGYLSGATFLCAASFLLFKRGRPFNAS